VCVCVCVCVRVCVRALTGRGVLAGLVGASWTGGAPLWERVILKEIAPGAHAGLPQAMVDALKPLFGINAMGVRRVRLNARLRRKDAHRPWTLPGGGSNWRAEQTGATGGTAFLVMRDHAHTLPCAPLARLEGTLRRGVLRAGGGALYASPELLVDFLVVSAFRLMTEGHAFCLDSVLVLPSGALLPIAEPDALRRRLPARGALGGRSGAALRAALGEVLPAAVARVEGWWHEVSPPPFVLIGHAASFPPY
jgi:hypothetical protein